MTQRISEVVRNTNETKIRVRLNLDGTGQGTLNTGVPFLDHMIDQIKRHGLFDIDIHCDGDLEIDDHHTVEDCGITLGQAFAQALGDKKGLRRYGHFYAPLDEALSRVVVDLSGRPGLFMDIPFTRARIGTFDVDLFSEFFQGFVNHALMTLHIDNLKGKNSHHQIESVFKALARALRMACEIDPRAENTAKALEHVGATVDVTNDPKLIAQADKIVFPGVGAMRDCMQGMREAGIDEVVRNAAFNKPVLAICVGMQALLQSSEENGGVDALGIFEGVVKHFPQMEGLKVPHMGWNQVHQMDPSHPMWNNIDQDARFYFVHSYYVEPKDENLVAATCEYGVNFCTAIHKDNLFATQFHPEKSHTAGLQLLKNFVEWNI